MSQHTQILSYLKAGNTLTGLDALKLFGTMKLATRISEIKKKYCVRIESEMVETTTRKRVARYRYLKDGELF